MRPRENPFAVHRVEALAFRLPDGLTWDAFLDRCAAAKWRGAIVGPQGSGKTTLSRATRPTAARSAVSPRIFSNPGGKPRCREAGPPHARPFPARARPSPARWSGTAHDSRVAHVALRGQPHGRLSHCRASHRASSDLAGNENLSRAPHRTRRRAHGRTPAQRRRRRPVQAPPGNPTCANAGASRIFRRWGSARCATDRAALFGYEPCIRLLSPPRPGLMAASLRIAKHHVIPNHRSPRLGRFPAPGVHKSDRALQSGGGRAVVRNSQSAMRR